MNCPKCKVEMKVGSAIEVKPTYRTCFWSPPKITYKNLKLISVLKCPQCGHSDDGKV